MELILKEKTYKNSGEFFDKCNKILIRYISFDIIDGLIVGVVNAIYMLIAGLPYAVLISVIVGITNLAPTFGPIVGAVIGGFILVLVNPWYALWFLVFTIILQTVDGYILKPRLFGESLGVSPLMILISIILGGRLFGVVGILLAIPFAAIFDFIWKDFILKKLEERKAKRYNI
jgi:predicted PurR-regulated permease PerM